MECRCEWANRKRKNATRKRRKIIICPYTFSRNIETGNGHKFAHVCHQANAIPMNTWKRPKRAKQEKHRIEKSKTPAQTSREIQTEQPATWTSPDGKTARQIDYLAINHRYRNTVRKSQAIQGWKSNMAQQKQHEVIQMNICLILLQRYKNIN